MKIVVPMAGLGTRFKSASDTNPEYLKPKPFITVKGRPMVRWATASLPFLRHPEEQKQKHHRAEPSDLTFVILKEHDEQEDIARKLREIYSSDITVVALDAVTRGAAETAYHARDTIAPDEELIITDSDHFFDGRAFAEAIERKGPETAGMIPVFRARNEGIPKWSYSLTEDGGSRVLKVGEKDRDLMERGAYANIGAYYFTNGKTFLDEVESAIRNNQLTGEGDKREFYVAPLYQNLINKGLRVDVAVIPEVWGLGTPSDLEYFLEHYVGTP